MKKISIISFLIIFSMFTILPCLAQDVMFNTKSLKYHGLDCEWAQKCTVNCIKIDEKEAIKRGGVPCKVCKGKTSNYNHRYYYNY